MHYRVLIAPAAARDLERLRGRLLERIDAHIRQLGEEPRPAGVKLLEGDFHRVRVGDWRGVYSIRDKAKEVVIARIGDRKETYSLLRRMGLL